MNLHRTLYQHSNSFPVLSDVYRYGFNGKEVDSEGMGGGSSTYDYGFRIYNAQLGKFLSVDPLTNGYPWYSPYQFAGNKPVWAIDLDGLEEYLINVKECTDSKGNHFPVEVRYKKVPLGIREVRTPRSYLRVNFDPRMVDVSTQFLARNREGISTESNRAIDAVIEESSVRNTSGLVKLGAWKLVLGFENNQGVRVSEVSEAVMNHDADFEQTLDEVISLLSQDIHVEVTVTGSASPLRTDIQGQMSERTRANNEILAANRAEATKEYIIQRAISDHGVQRADVESRILTQTKPVSGEDGNNDQNKRSATIEVTKR
jgi:RHS repeat-associated protein